MKGDLVVCAGGLTVWASFPGDGAARVRFGDDSVIATPEPSNGLAACLTSSGCVAVIRGHKDHAFTVTRKGAITMLGPVVGQNSVGVIPNGDVFWIHNLREYRRMRNGVVSTHQVPVDAGGQSIAGQGWTQIRETGDIQWTAHVGWQRIDGRLLTRVVEIGPWKIGMDTSQPRYLGYLTTDKSWWLVANTKTQYGPNAVLIDGQPWVGVSGDPCFFVRRDQFTRLSGSTPPPPPPPEQDTDDMTDAQVKDLFARLTRIERAIADQQEDTTEIKTTVLRLVSGTKPPPPPDTEPDIPPPPVEPGEIDPASVAWIGRHSPLGFKVTSEIREVTIERKADDSKSVGTGDNFQVCFPHSKAGVWKAYDDGAGTIYEGNACVIAKINGSLYGDTVEFLRAGQVCKRFSNKTDKGSWGLGPHSTKEPMRSWGPKSGETFWLFVCTPVRESVVGDELERSQFYQVVWP